VTRSGRWYRAGAGGEFRKVCELKGMARKEAEATAVRAFGAAALAQPKAATATADGGGAHARDGPAGAGRRRASCPKWIIGVIRADASADW